MKKIICILLAVFTIATVFFGCSRNNTEIDSIENDVFEDFNDDISADDNAQAEGGVGISAGVVDFEDAGFEYNGTPIEFDYKYNSSSDCKMGLQLYVNGVLQEFSVNNENYNLYKVNCKANKDEVFHVSFIPNNGTKGETSSLIFANIYHPEVIEFKGKVNTFGNYQRISSPMPWGIKMNADVENSDFKISSTYDEHKFTQEELEDFITIDNDGTKRNLLDDMMFFDTSKDIQRISKDNEKNIVFHLYGNLEGKYRISLYADFKQIEISGNNYIDIDVKKNTKYSVTIPVEILKDYKNVYAVAVSLDNAEGLIKSNSYYIE